jgi:hypothetical protein
MNRRSFVAGLIGAASFATVAHAQQGQGQGNRPQQGQGNRN